MSASRSHLLTVILAVALTLPYGAPGICVVLGRIAPREMTHDVDTAAWSSAGQMDMCCRLTDCGVPQLAPTAHGGASLPIAHVGDVDQRLVVSVDPADGILPLTPPPKV